MAIGTRTFTPLEGTDHLAQMKRIGRLVQPCPECGCNRDYRLQPRDGMMAFVISCPDCGESTVIAEIRNDKAVFIVEGTGKRYDPDMVLKGIKKRISDLPDDSEPVERILLLRDQALELQNQGNNKSADNIWTKAFKLCRDNIDDDACYNAYIMLIRDYFQPYNLQRHEKLVKMTSVVLADPRLPRSTDVCFLMVEDSVRFVDGAKKDVASAKAEIDRAISMYGSLSDSERAGRPYFMVEAYNTLRRIHEVLGDRSNALKASEKVIEEVRRARSAGAPVERRAMRLHLNAYRTMMMFDDIDATAKRMFDDSKIWKNSYYDAAASYFLANQTIGDYNQGGRKEGRKLSRAVADKAVNQYMKAITTFENYDTLDETGLILSYAFMSLANIENDPNMGLRACEVAFDSQEKGMMSTSDLKAIVNSFAALAPDEPETKDMLSNLMQVLLDTPEGKAFKKTFNSMTKEFGQLSQ